MECLKTDFVGAGMLQPRTYVRERSIMERVDEEQFDGNIKIDVLDAITYSLQKCAHKKKTTSNKRLIVNHCSKKHVEKFHR